MQFDETWQTLYLASTVDFASDPMIDECCFARFGEPRYTRLINAP
jgi:hypothetical protein